MAGRPAVFLDRDGTIVHDPGYLSDPEGARLLPGAAAAIARLNQAGLPVVVVTNQSGIGRGRYDETAFRAVQARIEALLEREGARIDAVYFCPHAPDRKSPCECRKPAPGLFLRAADDLGIELARSFFIGDRVRDVLPAERWGATGILVGDPHPDDAGEPPAGIRREASIEAAADRVLGLSRVDRAR